ncbi:MAG: hypothetical protein ACI9MR_005238, partial [Myxococcota bacterium]
MWHKPLIVTSMMVFATLAVTSQAQAACGGDGERVCCFLEDVALCDPGTVVVTGCIAAYAPPWSECKCPDNTVTDGLCVVPDCGGSNQRACCFGDETNANGGVCDAGLREEPGCSSDCACTQGGESSGRCLRPSPCGDNGERACCGGESGATGGGPCSTGLVEAAGCSGDCKCLEGGLTAVLTTVEPHFADPSTPLRRRRCS